MENIKEKGIRNKLCLKKNNSDSAQNTLTLQLSSCPKNDDNIEENCVNKHVSDKQNERFSNSNDSLEDFKSPKIKEKTKAVLNRFKFDNDKEKKKIGKTKSNLNTKSKNNNVALNQPLIESSLLKPQASKKNELILSIQCPLCLKAFKDDNTCTNHMKNCAVKNNITTKQLLTAIQLQSRQAEERKAMGLLAAPILPERKKAYRTKNYSTNDDPDLQLVLAMSESLYQAEQVVELKEAALLAGFSSEYVKDLSSQECRTTLQNFGFTTNKTADPPKSKKKKSHGPTILQSRSKEDKDRVLTERIACILTGDDAFTQISKNTEILNEKRRIVLRSEHLRKIELLNNKLWDRSRLTKKCNDFYVKELKSQILQTNQLQESVLKNSEHQLNDKNDKDDRNIDSLDCSIVYEPINIDSFNQNNSQKYSSQSKEIESMDYELDFRKIIISNWRDMLNDSVTSDIIIFVKNNKNIYAHKLVFYVQCSNILHDLESLNSQSSSQMKEKIFWPDKDELSVLAFLEFIYCGSIDKNISVFDQDSLILQIENLAMSYQVKDLFTYIRKKSNYLTTKRLNENKCVINAANEKRSSNNSSELQSSPTTNKTKNDSSDPIASINKLELDNTVFKNISKQEYINKRITLSPDLFESESEEENFYFPKSKENDQSQTTKGNVNLCELDNSTNLDQITKDIYGNKEKLNNYECSNSQQTVVNLSGNSSPESEKFSISPNERNLHEQLTPKSKKSSIHNDFTPKRITKAETSERNSPINYNDTAFEELICDNTEIMEMINAKSEISRECVTETYSNELQYEKDNSSELVNLKSSTLLELVQDINTNKSTSKKVDNIVSNDTIYCEKEENSMHNAVTPPKSDINNFKLGRNNLDKIKTNLSLFIEKVKRENARSISDSESDTETPDFQIKDRNPFLKVQQEDSYEYLRNDGPKNQNQKNYKQKRGISLLEKDVLDGECKNSRKFKNPSSKQFSNANFSPDVVSEVENVIDSDIIENFCSSFSKANSSNSSKKDTSFSNFNNESENIKEDEIEVSRYTKYKQLNKHDNSIKKYRDQIMFNLKQNNHNQWDTNVSTNIELQKNDIQKSGTVIEDITLVSESEDDEQNNIKSVETEKKEPNQQYLNSELKNSNESNIILDHTNYNIEGNSTSRLDLFTDQPQQSKISKTTNSVLKSNLNSKVIDLSLDSDEAEIKNVDSNLKQISMSDDKLNKTQNIIDDNNIDDNECEVINLSPVLIISTPENYRSHEKAVNNSMNELKNKTKEHKANIESGYFDDLECNDDWKISFAEKNKSYSKKKLNIEDIRSKNEISPNLNLLSSKSSRISSLVSSPILSQDRHYSQDNCNSLKFDKNDKTKSGSRDHSVSESRKLKIKSASAMNFLEKESKSNERNFKKSSSFTTPDQNKKSFKRSNIYDEDITPPLNYSELGTPELHEELKKFGLKPQSRSKAKLLLTHIYNETHSTLSSKKRTSSCNFSSEYEEPPPKKQHTDQLSQKSPSKMKNKLESGQDSENCPVIAEEMDYDDNDIACTSDNLMSIKDVFFKLIEANKDLYNKVLTYEPLSLESLHSLIKKNGLKIKMNNLMDFLDEQCITFQVQNSNGIRTKKKRNKMDYS